MFGSEQTKWNQNTENSGVEALPLSGPNPVEAEPIDTESAAIAIVALKGEFDLANRTLFSDALAVAKSSATVVVDLTEARYIDSSILECLIRFRREMESLGGCLLLAGLNESVKRLFEVCHLGPLFDIRLQLDDAINTANASRSWRVTLEALDL
jgi:anti-anti-sigma factor